jgi:glycosyltransferase involved in cell wall biosynthesis
LGEAVKVSCVIPVLNSHEIVRRQLLHFARIGLASLSDVEVIYMDDGSDPPIRGGDELPNFRIVATNDFRPWTWALARNAGAKLATGNYMLMCDLDYIIPRSAIDAALAFTGDKLRFKREFGVLDEEGNFTQDLSVLKRYGLSDKRIAERGVKLPPHPNNFCIRRDLYWQMGGYPEDRIDRPYPQGEDRWFKRRWVEFCNKGLAKESETDDRPMLYMFPNGQFCGDVDFNPMGLFHDLSRKNDFNPAHLKILSKKPSVSSADFPQTPCVSPSH